MKLKRLIENKFLIPLLLVLVTIPVIIPLFQPGYFSTQDYIYVARIYEMRQALMDGHFPVRWVPDFRYGEPLYNFYAPLPYYFAALIRIVSEFVMLPVTYLHITKLLFIFGFFASSVSMYWLGKKLFGRLGGFVTAVLYLYAPYHSVDLYVRGAISEAFALIIFPIIFLTIMQFAETKKVSWFVGMVLALASLFYTHNIMTVLFSPFILVWIGYWVLRKGWDFTLPLIGGFIFAAALGASYLLPAFFEKQFVQAEGLTSGYFDFRGHFVSIKQWFYSPWGYGASLWGDEDGMSYMLGFTHWIGFFLSVVLLILVLVHKKIRNLAFFVNEEVLEKKKSWWIIIFGIVISFGLLFSLLMTHVRSAFIWEKFSILAFTQFPWRFLGISIFFGSLFGGLLIYLLRPKFRFVVAVIFVVGTIVLNLQYFKPDVIYSDAVDAGYIGNETIRMENKLPRDYLPSSVKNVQRERLEMPEVATGEAEVKNYKYKTADVSFDAAVVSTNAVVEVPVTYFPGWTVYIDQKKADVEPLDKYGLIKISLPAGESSVRLRFEDTPIRTVGNVVSLIALIGLGGLFVWKRKLK